MGVSRRSYAAQRGVSEAAVRTAIATGRITTLPDGSIDPARADSAWCAPDPDLRSRGAPIQPQKRRWQRSRWSLLSYVIPEPSGPN